MPSLCLPFLGVHKEAASRRHHYVTSVPTVWLGMYQMRPPVLLTSLDNVILNMVYVCTHRVLMTNLTGLHPLMVHSPTVPALHLTIQLRQTKVCVGAKNIYIYIYILTNEFIFKIGLWKGFLKLKFRTLALHQSECRSYLDAPLVWSRFAARSSTEISIVL